MLYPWHHWPADQPHLLPVSFFGHRRRPNGQRVKWFVFVDQCQTTTWLLDQLADFLEFVATGNLQPFEQYHLASHALGTKVR